MGGGGGVGMARRSASSRETGIGGCSGDFVIGGDGGVGVACVPEI